MVRVSLLIYCLFNGNRYCCSCDYSTNQTNAHRRKPHQRVTTTAHCSVRLFLTFHHWNGENCATEMREGERVCCTFVVYMYNEKREKKGENDVGASRYAATIIIFSQHNDDDGVTEKRRSQINHGDQQILHVVHVVCMYILYMSYILYVLYSVHTTRPVQNIGAKPFFSFPNFTLFMLIPCSRLIPGNSHPTQIRETGQVGQNNNTLCPGLYSYEQYSIT